MNEPLALTGWETVIFELEDEANVILSRTDGEGSPNARPQDDGGSDS
jgi:hypothetical protein